MTDIHAVIAELKELEAKKAINFSDALSALYAMPRLIAYIDRLEAVASAARKTMPTTVRYGNMSDAQIDLHKALDVIDT